MVIIEQIRQRGVRATLQQPPQLLMRTMKMRTTMMSRARVMKAPQKLHWTQEQAQANGLALPLPRCVEKGRDPAGELRVLNMAHIHDT